MFKFPRAQFFFSVPLKMNSKPFQVRKRCCAVIKLFQHLFTSPTKLANLMIDLLGSHIIHSGVVCDPPVYTVTSVNARHTTNVHKSFAFVPLSAFACLVRSVTSWFNVFHEQKQFNNEKKMGGGLSYMLICSSRIFKSFVRPFRQHRM